MTLAEALREASARLLKAGVDDPRLEAEVLLGHALDVEREELFGKLREPLGLQPQASYETFVDRRMAHEPTAYIIGHREFFGLEFACSPAALIPRPDTELLVETAIDQLRARGAVLAVDVGTGSGAIAVSLATHMPQARIVATDISAGALALAQRNALAHCVDGRIVFIRGSLFEPLSGRFDLITANLPYIPSRTYNALPPEIREHEPEPALRAGRRGTVMIEAMLAQAVDRLAPGGVLLAEHAWNQGQRLREAAAGHFPTADIETRRDLAGLERLLVVRTTRD